ncbi:phosphatidylinositol 3,4,5-trisphosphate 3-phosphatase and protein-tyrosine-phosphatase PTEN1 isoform X3 [Neltuma alba]|uniref:phosphatidylinositol 3,4,5-trisphosphate 3-phosphatase and protein-tyrosine-phosphatase PTEN1 isoform X3 n=1 Tax=Neltuma alba TaxID=207710 RepID=UPI0010A59630|nr:phosphatidylinositol 3,4,5-trisphosphate 3-phosphatase and protein-tyrosine-phosphatase PTEN1-like isoform X3 [Prosopis alba]
MGLKHTKEGPPKVENLSLHHHLINYLAENLYIRNLVSKKRRRMLIAGYDLDMSYITDRLLAMSFPAERMRAMYRNPLWQVKSVLDMRHHDHYKIYNLCIEENYDPAHFYGRVEAYPFDDNHVPPLEMIKNFCESVHSWLSSDPKNIAVIHCMAGKGRTGLMVSSYLVYCGMSTDEALQLYADRRTTNNEGVPNQVYCPSVEIIRSSCRRIKKGYQQNYSPCYYLSYVEGDEDGKESKLEEARVVVQMDTEDPAIYQKSCLDHYFDKPVQLTGDVRVIFYQKMMGSRLFYCCFNTAFIRNGLLQLRMKDLDKVGNKGRSICGPCFCLEFLFGPANMKHSATPSNEDSEDEYP